MSTAVTPVVTRGNPNIEERLAGLISPDKVAALAGTSGAPNAANPFVTTSDSRLGASGALGGLIVVPGNGVMGDGATDGGPSLSTLANTTMARSGTIYLTPGKTYRIATAMTIPKGVPLWIPQGALLSPDSVVHTIQGPIAAGPWQIFNQVNGGIVRFEPSTFGGSGTSVKGRLPEVYPEWWGAVPDATTDSTAALNACIESIAGYIPAGGTDPALGARFANAMTSAFRCGIGNTPNMWIIGLISRSAPIEVPRLVAARDTLAHRGPVAAGLWIREFDDSWQVVQLVKLGDYLACPRGFGAVSRGVCLITVYGHSTRRVCTRRRGIMRRVSRYASRTIALVGQ